MYSKITKTIFAGMVLACATTAVSAQTVNKFGTNSMTIAPSAVLELESTTKGFLAPRMTAAKIGLISSPATGLLVYQTDGITGFYFYNGTSWLLNAVEGKLALPSTNVFVGNASGLATAVALSGDAAITNAGVLTIANSAITTAKILDANVTTVKILDANVTTAKIADANITTAKILDANVTTAKIADANITTAKILDANITTAKIADANITTAKIAANSITLAKLSPSTAGTAGQVLATDGTGLAWATPFTNTLNTANLFIGNASNIATGVALSGDATITNAGALTIASNAVTTTKIADANITTAKILDANVTTTKIADANITTAKILDANVTTAKIADANITTAKILDANVTTAKIAANSITLAKLSPSTAGTAGQVLATNGTDLAWATPFTNTLNTANLFIGNASSIATGVALSGDATITNAGALTIANAAVTTTKIADANVTTTKIANDAVTTTKILDANVTTAKMADAAVTYAKMQVITANKLLGSGLTGTAVAELTLGTGLSFTGVTLNALSNNIANVNNYTANQTLNATNSTVYTTGAITLTLPAASGNTGLTFLIKKTDTTTLTFSTSIYITGSGDAFTTLNYAKSLRIQSDGANWYVINN